MKNNDRVPAYESSPGDLVEGCQYYFHPDYEGRLFPALVVDVIKVQLGHYDWANELVCLCADCTIREFPIYWCKVFCKKQTDN